MTYGPRLINSLFQTNYCLGIATSGIWLESKEGTTAAKSDATACQGIMDANGSDAQLPKQHTEIDVASVSQIHSANEAAADLHLVKTLMLMPFIRHLLWLPAKHTYGKL